MKTMIVIKKEMKTMNDRARAKEAHDKILSELFRGDSNPTYELTYPALANLTSRGDVYLMEEYRMIKYVGENHNGYSVYQVRF